MRKLLLISILFLLHFNLFPQKLSQGTYWIGLTDKVGNGYSLSKPNEFLSQRALDRRISQKINLTVEDLPVSKIYLDSLNKLGLTILGGSKWFNSVIVESYDTLLLDTLDQISFISDFQYDTSWKKVLLELPAQKKIESIDENFSVYGSIYGPSFPQISMMNGYVLHDMGYRGENMCIAVIDGGFFHADQFPAFDSLWNEQRMLGYRDFTRSGTNFFNTASHGTSVLSTMAANVPGQIIGTAPKASYWLFKSEIDETESRLEEALWALAAEFADSVGADIITSSLGYSQFNDPFLNYSYPDMDGKTTLVTRAAEKAFSKGLVVVISAGNEGNKTWRHITAPSDGMNVISVGASDTSGNIAFYSSRGPSSDQRIKPDVLAVGYKTIIINSEGLLSEGYGTSFAAPQVSGLIACLWEAAPEKTNLEIISSVRQSASNFLNPSDSTGYGTPDFLRALNLLKASVPLSPVKNITIVPNPNQGIFEVRSSLFSREEDVRISIYDAIGKIIYTGTKRFMGGFTVINELEGLGSGTYLMVIESKVGKYFANIVILKP